MKFTLYINDTTNDEFQRSFAPSYAVARLLRATANRIEGHPHFSPGHSQPVLDQNGNTVGHFDVWEDDQKVEIHLDPDYQGKEDDGLQV